MIGKVCHRFDTLPSTNTYARALVANDKPAEGTAILTANQTAGRGQFGRQWVTEPYSALTVSFILYPVFLPSANVYLLGQAVALGVAATVSALVPTEKVQIKWPNDIFVGEKKVAGILIENAISTEGKLQNAVAGIGINLGQTAFPPDLPHATSCLIASGQLPDWLATYHQLCTNLDHFYALLQSGAHAEITEQYQARLYGLGVQRQFIATETDSVFEATVIGTDADGQLRLRHTDGEMQVYTHGGFRWVLE